MRNDIREKTIRAIEDLVLAINDTDNDLYADCLKETKSESLDYTNQYYEENYSETRNLLIDTIKTLSIYAYNLKKEQENESR